PNFLHRLASGGTRFPLRGREASALGRSRFSSNVANFWFKTLAAARATWPPRTCTPLAKVETTGRITHDPQWFKRRKEPNAAPLGAQLYPASTSLVAGRES